MKKKVMFLTMGAMLLSPAAAFASGTGVADNVNLTTAEAQVLKAEADAKDAELAQSLDAQAVGAIGTDALVDGEWFGVTVPNYMQENGYYCGPASVRQALGWHKTKSGGTYALPAQSTLASKAGTTSAGSGSPGLRNALNAYGSYYGFSNNPYVVARLYGQGYANPVGVFETRVKGVLSSETNVPHVSVRTQYIPRYNGKALDHYMVISAYSNDFTTGAKDVRTVDPNYMTAYYGIHWNPIGTTTANGVFKAAYEYDKYSLGRVSDPAMANYSMIY